MKLFAKKSRVLALHTLIGAVIGILVLHPVTTVIYWYEFRHDLGVGGESLWRFILSRFESALYLEMVPMSLVFAIIG